MAYHPKWWSKSGVFLTSVLLAGLVVNLFFKTPNVVGGGEAMMIGIFFLAIFFKVTIEFFLTRMQKKRDQKRDHKSVGKLPG